MKKTCENCCFVEELAASNPDVDELRRFECRIRSTVVFPERIYDEWCGEWRNPELERRVAILGDEEVPS